MMAATDVESPKDVGLESSSREEGAMINQWTGSVCFGVVLLATAHFSNAQSQQPAGGDLGGTSWQLVKFQGGDDKTLVPADKTRYTLAFDNDGSVSVRIDCNRGRGTWKSSGPNQLEFGPLALTRAMCPPAPLNDRIPKDWQYVRSYTLKNGHLFLSLMADGGIYEFEPISQSQSATGEVNLTVSGLPASFAGILPCADCPGIQYQLNLLADHTFVSKMTYEERNASSVEQGRWRLTDDGKTIVLQGSGGGAPEKFALRGADTLRMLGRDGQEIESKLNYDLQRAPKFMAIDLRETTSSSALGNTYWKLVHLGDAPVNAASANQEPHIVLDSQTHRVSGSGGCNRVSGSYQLAGDQLSFGQMVGTMMACAHGMDTERAFLNVLGQVKMWKMSGSTLELLDGAGKVLASFEEREMK